MMIVDAPALERSQVGLRVAAHMDGVVLVVGADAGGAPAALAAKQNLLSAGANVLGIVYSKASAPVVVMDRLLRQAS
jgi:Mrp family chromosome partitioning ATPase